MRNAHGGIHVMNTEEGAASAGRPAAVVALRSGPIAPTPNQTLITTCGAVRERPASRWRRPGRAVHTGAMSTSAARASYDRPYAVPATLAELRGPTGGVVVLPLSLAWTGRRRFDLARPADLARMYKVVLHEARDVDDIRRFLNRDLLVEHWDEIRAGRTVRALWESRFSDLRRAPV